MKGMDEKRYERRMKKLEAQAANYDRYQKYKTEREKIKPKRKSPETSKLIVAAVMLLCVEILVFTEYIMMKTWDTSCLYALIGIPATLAPTIWGYYSKSKAQNTAGGITYEMAMAQLESQAEEQADDAVG